jgi:hypothetical protein
MRSFSSEMDGTLMPFTLSKARIELTFTLLELKLTVYFKVPLPSLLIFMSSISSMHDVNDSVQNKSNENVQNFMVQI